MDQEIKAPLVTVVYIHPHTENDQNATRFVNSFLECLPGHPCNMVVVVNGGSVTDHIRNLFRQIRGIQFFEHDDSGWDIGAYVSLARIRDDLKLLFCCGGHTRFINANWLKTIMSAWSEYGPGMYGTNASYQVRPHLNTSGFMVSREDVAAYPHPVTDRFSRYEFEWGKGALWRRVRRSGQRTMLVTNDGAWWPEEWRIPKNIYRDGDQSNCLTWFSHSFRFRDEPNPAFRKRLTELANGLHNIPKPQLAIDVDAVSREKKLI